ncbi:MAG: hypothetical protein RKL32_20220 [Gammaproteobacteria bacterium]
MPGPCPEDAGAVEIFASIEPRDATIEVRRAPQQRVALVMHDGMRSIVVRPREDRLWITPRADVERYRLVVLRWLD